MSSPSREMRRLFVAIDPPDAVRAVLEALPQPIPGITWTPPHQYHLTLRFIGDTPVERLPAIERTLGNIQVESFILPVGGAGSFPPNRPPRVLWVGVGTGHPRLFQLRQRVDDALLASGLTELDVRRFEPHFTLGRCNERTAANAVLRFVRANQGFEGPPFRVSAFTLYESELRPGGAVHTPRLRVGLQDGAVRD